MTFETEEGYTCACPYDYALEPDGYECKRKQLTNPDSNFCLCVLITEITQFNCFS